MESFEFTPAEVELLSQALGEAVAAQDAIIHQAKRDMAIDGHKAWKNVLKSLEARHADLLALMRKVDGSQS